MLLNEYILKRVWTAIDTDWQWWHQCVDQAKDFSKEVLWIPLGTFWGSALTGWHNKSNTFPTEKFERIINDASRIDQVPLPWDMVFFWGPTSNWHVGCRTNKISDDPYMFELINQNTGNGDGKWEDDYTKVERYNYNMVLGWYRARDYKASKTKEDLIEEFNLPEQYIWAKVSISLIPKRNKPNVTASYNSWLNRITIYPLWFKQDKIKRDAIMRHEGWHKIRAKDMSHKIKELWDKVSAWDQKIMNIVNKAMGTNYTANWWVSNYAKKSANEDFSETLEESYIKKMNSDDTKYESWADFKILIAEAIFDLYIERW